MEPTVEFRHSVEHGRHPPRRTSFREWPGAFPSGRRAATRLFRARPTGPRRCGFVPALSFSAPDSGSAEIHHQFTQESKSAKKYLTNSMTCKVNIYQINLPKNKKAIALFEIFEL